MITRIRDDRRARALIQRLEHPGALLLAIGQACIALVGWIGSPLWLAVAAAAQLAVGGIGAVRLIGPASPEMGFARYATPAVAGLALTLFGRLLPPALVLPIVPVAAVLLWGILLLELRISRGRSGPFFLVALAAICFAAAAGVAGLFGLLGWPPPMLLVAAAVLVLAMRAAEARGRIGTHAFGQAILHVLAVGQLGLAVALLALPGLVAPAMMGLAFYVWAGAADGLERGSSGIQVLAEYGPLVVLGLVVALLLQRL